MMLAMRGGNAKPRALFALALAVASFGLGCHRSGAPKPESLRPTQVVVGGDTGGFSCARMSDGTARCWGAYRPQNDPKVLRPKVTSPEPFAGLSGVRLLAASAPSNRACAWLTDGTVSCWGFDEYWPGGAARPTDIATPTKMAGLEGVTDLAFGRAHACAVVRDSTVRCWGKNDYGQLGDGTNEHRMVPSAVSGLRDAVAVRVSGGGFSCALLTDGTARCWGANGSGQLGDDTRAGTQVPHPVVGVSGIAELSLGDTYACARLRNGTVSCWGAIDVFDRVPRVPEPPFSLRRVPGIGGATALASGAGFACALHDDGLVSCWGEAIRSGLRPTLIPARVPRLPRVVGLASSMEYTCAWGATGPLYCWGLGTRDAATRALPTPVPAVADVQQVAIGTTHACAISRDGAVHCWGANGGGQLGDGTTATSDRASTVLLTGEGGPRGGGDGSRDAADDAPVDAGVVSPPRRLVTCPSKPYNGRVKLVADGSGLYWTDSDDGAIYRLGPGSTRPATVASTQAGRIALDANDVYWADARARSVMRVPKAGGQPVAAVETQWRPFSVALGGDFIYWPEANPTRDDSAAPWGPYAGEYRIMRVSKRGGEPEVVSAGGSELAALHALGLVADDGAAYWANSRDRDHNISGGIYRQSTRDRRPVLLAREDGPLSPVAVDASQLFWISGWTDRSSCLSLDRGPEGGCAHQRWGLFRVQKTGGDVLEVEAGDGQFTGGAITSDGAAVYWVRSHGQPQGAELMRTPKAGGATRMLATGLFAQSSVAVDQSTVYFSTTDGIWSVTP
jgi:alpha-tubulin suppressor-like RCC1 family protein